MINSTDYINEGHEEDHQRTAGNGARAVNSDPSRPLAAREKPWPQAPADIVYHGLAGEIINAVLPHTEADPLAILVQLLVAFGCAVGPGPYTLVGATRHTPRLFAAIVGRSAKVRKGDSWEVIRALLKSAGIDESGVPISPRILPAVGDFRPPDQWGTLRQSRCSSRGWVRASRASVPLQMDTSSFAKACQRS